MYEPIRYCRAKHEPSKDIVVLDRQFAVVKDGKIVTDKDVSSISKVEPYLFYDGTVFVTGPGVAIFHFPYKGINDAEKVWVEMEDGTVVQAIDQGDEMASWFTTSLSIEKPGDYRLVMLI